MRNLFGLTSCALILSVIAVGYVANADKTRCYVCNEISEPGCKDPFNRPEEFIADCEKGETFCRKMIQTVNGKSSVVRQCAKELYKDNYEGCYKTAGKSTQTVCTCKASDPSKPCNSGLKVKFSFYAMLASIVLAVLFK